jgi:hypothetical protein
MPYIGTKPENIIATAVDTTTGKFSGEVDAASLDISGNVDIDGILEADAMTLNGTSITGVATLLTGISNGNLPVFTSGVADDDFLRVAGTSIEGRSASEVLSDIGASAVAGSSSIVTTGALNSGSITSGFGTIDTGSSTITTTGAVTTGALSAKGGAVFNEDSADVDFRVESNGNANMLFVDGGTDAVIVGHNASRQTLFNTTATSALQIEGTTANTASMSIARNSNDDNGPQLVLAKSNGTANGAVTVVTNSALLGRISFQGADGTHTVEGARIEGLVDGTPGANDMPGRLLFSTTADGAATVSERMRIDSSGNVLVGKTVADNTTVGVRIQTDGFASFARNGSFPLLLNRKSSDGTIVDLRKDGATVGTIGAYGAAGVYISAPTNGGSALVFNDNAPILYPAKNNSGTIAAADNAIDLGASGVRFKDIYLSGGAFIGGTGTANKLDDYEEGLATVSFTSSGASFNYTIRKCTYTKVGRIVHIQIYMQLDGSQTLTGNTVTITGLPFTSSNATSYVTGSIAGIRYVSLDTNYTHLQARVATNTTTINLLQNGAGQPGINLNSNKLSNASGQVFINMSYITA